MSFLWNCNFYFKILFICGLRPFNVNKRANYKYSWFKWIYTVLLMAFIIVWMSLVVLAFAIIRSLEVFGSLRNIIRLLQVAQAVFLYSAISICYLWKVPQHVNFLNAVIDYDKEIHSIFGIIQIDPPEFFRRNILVTLLVICWYSIFFSINSIGVIPHWPEILSIFIQLFMVFKISMLTVHIQVCANLLYNRYKTIEQKCKEKITNKSNSKYPTTHFLLLIKKTAGIKTQFSTHI